jgi:tetratricopeptide (TPR) repeat protein
LLPEVHLLLSELAPVVTDRSEAGKELERVAVCAPHNSALLVEGGLIALVNLQPQLAAAMWRQAGTADPRRLPLLIRFAASRPAMDDHLPAMLPTDPVLLVHVARESFLAEEDLDLRRRITKHAKAMMPTARIDDSHRWYLEGILLLLEDQRDAAIDRLTKATQEKPLEVAWRFDLATALEANGMTELAREHASFCARMEPDNAQYTALLKRLIRTSLTSADADASRQDLSQK